ncbi:AraC family transcriptional regulator [Pseudonocardia sp. KRD291]|uniref:helix-turn-helix domain-containing protein n=1 Tax=Pseudonocardia sp. KRD291 TaxID=2792007 RepID=UPI001C4A3625|nr:helix-turn-helix domain-containing protein [Pseudonocardia sp. KRD291]MBW0104761.1 AraC family transcriptional regulator [Pseudonocardia sp. KRD291]
MTGTHPLQGDTRGIVGPVRLSRNASLNRYPAHGALNGLVGRFWAVRWSLPDGVEHTQAVLTHPSVNVTVGSAEDEPERIEAGVHGVTRELSNRVLRRSGWTVGARMAPGGIGAFLAVPAQDVTDRVVGVETLGLDGPELVAAATSTGDEARRVEILAAALTSSLERADPDRVAAARDVTGVARLAETDRSLRRVEQLADAAGIGVRSLQRLFRTHAGVSPTWVLRRYRLLDAAERVRAGESVSWAEVARELGFADQAHLVRDFRSALGETPAAYARARQRESSEGTGHG